MESGDELSSAGSELLQTYNEALYHYLQGMVYWLVPLVHPLTHCETGQWKGAAFGKERWGLRLTGT